jgi:hypothetical protein
VSIQITLSEPTTDAIAQMQHGADLYAEALADEARDRFRDRAHVITGAMRQSASVITAYGSDYAENVGRAAELNPAANFASEMHAERGEALVQVPVGYAAFEEFGTSRRPAHPALVPAVESVAADAEAIARRVFNL